METLKAISQRASLMVKISPREIEQEKIEKVLDAARFAPSAINKQPWRFVVVQGKENVTKLVNETFANWNLKAGEAPVLIFAFANPKDDVVVGGREFYLFDVALAVENMILAATDMGLVTHLMTSLDEEKLKKSLEVPNEVRFVVATPLAYPVNGSYEKAVEERLKARTRKSLPELVFRNVWGNIS